MQRVRRSLCLLCVLQLSEDAHEILGLPIGIQDVDRQIAVQSMRDLVDVISDVAELGKQRRVQLEIAGRCRNRPVADQPLAQARYRESGLPCINGAPQVLVGGQPDKHLFRSRARGMGASPRHSFTHQGWGSGRGNRALTGGVQGSGGALSPARGI